MLLSIFETVETFLMEFTFIIIYCSHDLLAYSQLDNSHFSQIICSENKDWLENCIAYNFQKNIGCVEH